MGAEPPTEWPRESCPFLLDGLRPFEERFPNLADEAEIDISESLLMSCSPGVLFRRIHILRGGKLVFNDRNITLRVREVRVDVGGEFLAGAERCRLYSRLDVELVGDAVSSKPSGEPSKGLLSGGRIEFHGKKYHPTWTRLARTAAAGDTLVALVDAVNWEVGQEVLFTTTASHDCPPEFAGEHCGGMAHQNEVRHIVGLDSSRKILWLDAPLMFEHHSSAAFQGEVALLSRRIRMVGSESGDFFGGHVIVWAGIGRFSGVEGRNMGQRNQLGRYPFHFHVLGSAPECFFQECSVVHSNFRAYVVHGTNQSRVSRNVAYDVYGFGLYLEDGVEERNTIEYNLIAHVHPILRPATASNEYQVERYDLIVPSDIAASPFLVSNAFNTFRGNAASGGWSGFAFLNFHEPLGLFRGIPGAPWRRPSLLFEGNTAHSSGFYAAAHGACIYQGGWMRFNGTTNYLDYSSGPQIRQSIDPLTGSPTAMVWRDTKVWRCNRGITYRGALNLFGLEVHDCKVGASVGSGSFVADDALFHLHPSWISGAIPAQSDGRHGVIVSEPTTSVNLTKVTFRGFGAGTDVAVNKGAAIMFLSDVSLENSLTTALVNVSTTSSGAGATRHSCAFPFDWDGDGFVNGADLSAMLEHWGEPPLRPEQDCNGDNLIDVIDVACLLDHFVEKEMF